MTRVEEPTVFSRTTLQRYVADGLVTERHHPELDLLIYNYSPQVQFGRLWDDVTLQCRGLVMNQQGNVVARSFGKFFNLEEHAQEGMPPIPNEPFEVYEKMDGSLGIVFHYADAWHVCTRGSFESEQAVKAAELLRQHDLDRLDPDRTYLVEIIYPENRIVVNYGDEERLVLLAIIETQTGVEHPLDPHLSFELVRRYDGVQDFRQIRDQHDQNNREGFVVRFQSGMRVKLKFEEYVRIHRVRSMLSELSVWRWMSGQEEPADLTKLPDELHDEVKQLQRLVQQQYDQIEQQAQQDFARWRTELRPQDDSRKAAAAFFLSCPYPAVLFRLLDGRDYADVIWKLTRPKGEEA